MSAAAFRLDLDEVGCVSCAIALFACHEVMRPINPSAELRKALVLEGSAPR